MKFKRILILALVGIIAAGVTAGVVYAGKPDWMKQQEKTSDQIAEAATSAVPYPLSVVKTGGFLERKNLVERLKRFSSQNKVGYVYLMSFGKFVGYYAIRGKISSTMSQLTNVNQTWAGDGADTVVDSIGDDGSFGPNEDGSFFFTTNGTMVQTNLEYVYSDQPLSIDVPNLLKKK